jgi:hypothetical protein
MLKVQQKLGKDNFPLIDQTYYPNHREMVSDLHKHGVWYPCPPAINN